MNIVLDTNVFISGVFFSGPPYQILKAWRDDKIQLVVSLEILEEYQRVGKVLSEKFPGVDLDPIIDLLIVKAELVMASSLPEQICEDSDDDRFLACAIAGKTKLIISGDKHLLRASGYHNIEVVSPRKFVDEYVL
ncbi:MAG: putative toxin-antitoxin system toxin component, PIN family [Desulfobacterales bacterium]|nr:putative toxin-antitoxin system toxin component, PIN family [Desulfobacterales bacterium]